MKFSTFPNYCIYYSIILHFFQTELFKKLQKSYENIIARIQMNSKHPAHFSIFLKKPA